MNIFEKPEESSKNPKNIPLCSIFSALTISILSGCSHSLNNQTGLFVERYKPLPYRPLSELGTTSSDMSLSDDFVEWKGLRDFLVSGPVYAHDEFVGDDGTVHTREELESSDE